MTAQEACNYVLNAYRSYYDVDTAHPAAPFAAEAVFHSHDQQYFLVKSATISEAESNEYVFFAVCGRLDAGTLRSLDKAAWTTGLARAGWLGQVFVSPALDGYVLAVGLWAEDLEDVPGRMERLVDSFPEVQLFGTQRISDYHYWTKYIDGKVARNYIYQDAETSWDEGDLTPEELALGFDCFPGTDRESEHFPGEEDVLDIAAAWGVDPRFQKKTYPPSVGWVCD